MRPPRHLVPLALACQLAWPLPSLAAEGAAAAAPQPSAVVPGPPANPIEPLEEELLGLKVQDPFRWLEDASQPRVQAWVRAQRAYATSGLRRLPGTEAWKARILSLSQGGRLEAPWKAGAFWFARRSDGKAPQALLQARRGLSGPWQTAYDPNAEDPSGLTSLDQVSASPDGKLVALWTSKGGDERSRLRFLDWQAKRFLPESLPETGFGSLAWLGGGLVAYTAHAGDPGKGAHQVRLHRLGAPASEDRVVFEHPLGAGVGVYVQASVDGRFAIIGASQGSSGGHELFLWDRREAGLKPYPLVQGFQATYRGDFRGHRYVALTTAGAPLGRVVALDLDGVMPGAPLAWQALVAEGQERASDFALAGDGLVLERIEGGTTGLHWFGPQGEARGRLPLPSPGVVSGLWGEDGQAWISFQHSGPAQAGGTYGLKLGEAKATTWLAPSATTRPQDFVVKTLWVVSKDGTRVPVDVVRKKGLAGPLPTILYGYGGFDASMLLRFSAPTYAWLEAGGGYAMAHLRGGGEYGEAWHKAGMFANKPRVFEDFEAAADGLKAAGLASTASLGIEGGSNGGLLVAAALARDPSRYGAAVCKVPLTDMVRYPRFLLGKFWVSEYGDPQQAEDLRYLHAYSPYHQLRSGLHYPATLVTAGASDGRVDPLHARKFVAQLQRAQLGPAPIWYVEEESAGHGAGKPLAMWAQDSADVLAFFAQHLGLAAPKEPTR